MHTQWSIDIKRVKFDYWLGLMISQKRAKMAQLMGSEKSAF